MEDDWGQASARRPRGVSRSAALLCLSPTPALGPGLPGLPTVAGEASGGRYHLCLAWLNWWLTPARCLVPVESRRVKLQGILADLRDVDGLPPKVTGPPPGTPQPRPHEGKRPLHSGPVPQGPRHPQQREAAELSPGLLCPQGRGLASSLQPPCPKSSSVCLSPPLFVCPALSVSPCLFLSSCDS